MREDIIKEKLQKIFYECDKHILRIESASKKCPFLFRRLF